MFLTGAMMVILAIWLALDLGPKPGLPITDVIGAAICFVLGMVMRSLARRFEQVI